MTDAKYTEHCGRTDLVGYGDFDYRLASAAWAFYLPVRFAAANVNDSVSPTNPTDVHALTLLNRNMIAAIFTETDEWHSCHLQGFLLCLSTGYMSEFNQNLALEDLASTFLLLSL